MGPFVVVGPVLFLVVTTLAHRRRAGLSCGNNYFHELEA